MSNVNLSDSLLDDAIFARASLFGANLQSAQGTNTIFDNADLR